MSIFFDTIISNQLYFSSINQFNDPYDCHLVFPKELSDDEALTFIEKNVKSEGKKHEFFEAYKKKPQDFLAKFEDAYQKKLSYHGICCFSKTKENQLMWSHYADSHRGVCLGFDYEIITSKFKQYDEIEYDNSPYVFDINNIDKSIAKTILRKSKNWEYEEEVRFLMERSKSIDFYQDALVEVNFGSKCTKRNMMSISYLVGSLGYSNCEFFLSKNDDLNYSMLFENLNLEGLRKDVLEESKEIRHSIEIDFSDILTIEK